MQENFVIFLMNISVLIWKFQASKIDPILIYSQDTAASNSENLGTQLKSLIGPFFKKQVASSLTLQ